MKYLIAVLTIALSLSLVAFILIRPAAQPDEKDVVLTVNGYKATNQMLEESEKKRSSHHENWTDFLNCVAVEQVLIQEAQRRQIDQEPAFREAIKEHYEQSLIKVLLERQNLVIDDTVGEEEIDTFLGYFGRTVTFSLAQGEGAITPEIDWTHSRASTELFDNLSSALQPALAGLRPGASQTVFDDGNAWYAVRMEAVGEPSGGDTLSIPRETIRTIIAAHKREQQINTWLNTLIANADISIKGERQ